MKVMSNIVSIEAWEVDVEKVKTYLDGKPWTDLKWVKALIDDTGKTIMGKRGLSYFPEETKEVDYEEFKTYPARLNLNGGAVCYNGDYILRYERDFRGKVPLFNDKPISNVFYNKVGKEEFVYDYVEV